MLKARRACHSLADCCSLLHAVRMTQRRQAPSRALAWHAASIPRRLRTSRAARVAAGCAVLGVLLFSMAAAWGAARRAGASPTCAQLAADVCGSANETAGQAQAWQYGVYTRPDNCTAHYRLALFKLKARCPQHATTVAFQGGQLCRGAHAVEVALLAEHAGLHHALASPACTPAVTRLCLHAWAAAQRSVAAMKAKQRGRDNGGVETLSAIRVHVSTTSASFLASTPPRHVAGAIPRVVHFIHGMASMDERSGGAQPPVFGLIHYLAVVSALEVHKPTAVIFHYHTLPAGVWWERARPLLTLTWHALETELAGRCMAHHAHRSDVLRLQILVAHGGLYLDMDTVSLRPLPSDVSNAAEFVMGWQNSTTARTFRQGKAFYGLCNAVLASAKGAYFARLWLDSFRVQRSNGHDDWYDEFGVTLPAELVELHPRLVSQRHVTLLGPRALFTPLWTTVREDLFGGGIIGSGGNDVEHADVLTAFPEALVFHLWASSEPGYGEMLDGLDRSLWWWNTTRYGALARLYLEEEHNSGGERGGGQVVYVPKRTGVA